MIRELWYTFAVCHSFRFYGAVCHDLEEKRMGEKKAPVTNPVLKETISRLHKGEHAREHQMVTLHILLQAQLLAPVSITPGRTNTQIQFQLITTPDGRAFFPAFTDLEELKKGFSGADQQTVILPFADYARMILRDKAAQGLVVNPFGDSLTLEQPLVEFLERVRLDEQPSKPPIQS